MVISTRPLPLGGLVTPHTLPQDAVFVIGDIHGQWTALHALLAHMGKIRTGTATRLLVTLGDCLHKGPKSRRVLGALLGDGAAELAQADLHIGLLGNHEILFARALMALDAQDGDHSWIAAWMRNGGESLLASWKKDRPGTPENRLRRWRDSFKPPLSRLALWAKAWEHEGMAAVHAGFAPGVDWRTMGAADAYTLVRGRATKHPHHWATVRAPFLDWQGGFGGRLVAHGHTPPRGLFRRKPRSGSDLIHAFDASASKGRICLDGGAGFGIGVAGALIYDGTVRFFFTPC